MLMFVFFFKQKTAYEMRISDWSSDVCSSDLDIGLGRLDVGGVGHRAAFRTDHDTGHAHVAKQRRNEIAALQVHEDFAQDRIDRRESFARIVRIETTSEMEDRKSTRLNSSH